MSIPIDTYRTESGDIPLTLTIDERNRVKKVKLLINPTTTPMGLPRPDASTEDDRMMGKIGSIHGDRMVTSPAKNENPISKSIC